MSENYADDGDQLAQLKRICPVTDRDHEFFEIPHPMRKYRAACMQCCLLIQTLPCGQGVISTPMVLKEKYG